MKQSTRLLTTAAFAAASLTMLALVSAPVHAAPLISCEQQGEMPAMPPLIPKPLRIHECASFAGAMAMEIGKQWCEQAAAADLGPNAKPPVVTYPSACPSGAKAYCQFSGPGDSVTVRRYYYPDQTTPMAQLKRSCEASTPGIPAGVFHAF